jgi:uncharacterized protein YjbJ (UPF0337 family)
MSEFTDKIKGAVNETVGKAKQAIGRESNDTSLEAEGAGQEAKGNVQTTVGKAKGAVKGAIDKF